MALVARRGRRQQEHGRTVNKAAKAADLAVTRSFRVCSRSFWFWAPVASSE